jgi:pseudaminic acid synthase
MILFTRIKRVKRIAREALRNVNYGIRSSEQANVKFRRSLYFVKEGEVITAEHIKSIRPGYGLAPKYMKKILGKKTISPIKRGALVSLNVISF